MDAQQLCVPAVQARLQDLVDRGKTPGIQYVAVDAAGSICACAVGWADLRSRRPMELSTTMMAYSMSKTITAVAVLQLIERGVITLDAPITRYLPRSPYGDRVTVAELLTHTAGVPNPIPLRWVHPVSEHDGFDEHATLSAIWRDHPHLARTPGTRYAYSNIGYWMLGAVVEHVAEAPFTAYVRTRILDPLDIAPAELGYTVPDPTHHATGYLERWSFANLLSRWLLDTRLLGDYDGSWRRIADHYPNGPAFGGLVGTARAFGVFLQDQLRPHSVLLNDSTRALLYTTQQTRAGSVVPMTLGWHVGHPSGTSFFFKEGGGGGFHCLMRTSVARGIASVVMTNATNIDVMRCLNTADALLPR
jgi:D-alanyl-D-alanine carboxypeptidase